MTPGKRKKVTRDGFVFACALSAFVIFPVFSSQAEAGDIIVPPAAVPAAEVPAGPGMGLPSNSQNQNHYEKGPGVEVTNPVYPIVKEVDKYSYEQMERDIRAFDILYQDKVKVEVIGTSLDGRKIYDIIVGNADSDKQVVIQGGIHGREYITSMLIMKQAGEMLEAYETGTYLGRSYREMLSQTAVHFIPMVNPDGITISQFGHGSIRSPELSQVIQNAYQMDVDAGSTKADFERYLTLWKSNARGVDLNRNYDADWDSIHSKGRPSSTGYKGETPLSEPESLALANLLKKDQIKACLNYHAMGKVIYWDVAGNKQSESSLKLATQYSADSGYQLLGELGKGGVKDWLQIKEPSIPSITVEVGSSAAPVSFSEFPAIWQQNQLGPVRMLGFVLNYETE